MDFLIDRLGRNDPVSEIPILVSAGISLVFALAQRRPRFFFAAGLLGTGTLYRTELVKNVLIAYVDWWFADFDTAQRPAFLWALAELVTVYTTALLVLWRLYRMRFVASGRLIVATVLITAAYRLLTAWLVRRHEASGYHQHVKSVAEALYQDPN